MHPGVIIRATPDDASTAHAGHARHAPRAPGIEAATSAAPKIGDPALARPPQKAIVLDWFHEHFAPC